MSKEQVQHITGYVVGNDLLRALLDYLQTRPFGEVSVLISELVGQIKAQEAEAKKNQPKAPASPVVDNAVKKAMEEVKKNAAPAAQDDLAKKRKSK